jgi:hypothetical protein
MLVVNPENVFIFNMYKVSLLYTTYSTDTNYSQFTYVCTVCCCFVVFFCFVVVVVVVVVVGVVVVVVVKLLYTYLVKDLQKINE